MLRTIPLTLLIFFASLSINAQGLTENFVNLETGLNFNALHFDGNNISLNFTENSVRQLEYSFSKDVSSNENYASYFLGISFGKHQGITHTINLEVPLGSSGNSKYGYAMGYSYLLEMDDNHLLIRPSMGAYTGTSKYKLGEIDVDASGIIITDIEYVNTKVITAFRQTNHVLTPKVTATYLSNQKYGIWMSLNYDLRIGGSREQVHFSADNHHSAEIEYFDSTIDLQYDQVRPTDSVYGISGISFSFGISAYYNRD